MKKMTGIGRFSPIHNTQIKRASSVNPVARTANPYGKTRDGPFAVVGGAGFMGGLIIDWIENYNSIGKYLKG